MPDPVDAVEVSDLPLDDLVACHECDLLMRKPVLALGEKAQCPRCGYELYAHRHNVVERSLALVLAAFMSPARTQTFSLRARWSFPTPRSM